MNARSSFLLILFLIGVTVAGQAMIATLKLPDLVRQSEIIALATVVSSTETETDREQISTFRNELKPDKILKGFWKPGTPFVVMTRQCGKPGQIGWIEDQPQFPDKGTQCLVFLKRVDVDKLEIVNLVQGVWPIVGGKPTGMGLGYAISQIEELVKQQKN
ncbi:MAG TPA: hypothetical protein PLU72_04490 [Candidatus Ozemobacteraceae bacterium]|nr:hypothetical protein [Candidatus Ozemobacteraceae bacterium]HQG29330.1 hypothetical protein [Candidatus Ozemobacteraceae bacterium]